MIHKDYGKNAVTFFRRSDGRAIRVASRPDAWGPPDPEREAISARVRTGRGTPEDERRFHELQLQRSDAILDAPLERLFSVNDTEAPLPGKARIHQSIVCEACGESTMETRARRFGGQMLCIPCFDERDRRF